MDLDGSKQALFFYCTNGAEEYSRKLPYKDMGEALQAAWVEIKRLQGIIDRKAD